MNEEEKESIEEFRKQLRLAINIDDVTTAIRNDNAQTILNLIDKLQKENEELKEDRKNNNEMIAFAQNEILNYMSGYEEGKKHKMTAVAQVVENQQYYIVRKQMEKYEEHIKRLQKENELAKQALIKKCNIADSKNQLLRENKELKEYIAIAPNLDEMTATKYRNIRQDAYIQGRAEEQQKAEQIIYENYIPVQKVKDKISERQFELQQEYKDFEDDSILIVLQELLEGRK